ncbi:hypothetical protein TRFO_27477 [Tritrichomonas foetus]|uniref:Uncharacterized protein n=1 Tax=Tritrichomonas foetus TaxID=1144522 RepID=A0A1J4K0K9_9EUKA|nr:hypothetical protein TRFO_27477 [Tritrichomonas foetus]|eukprot:OHT04919.1 hypothetical protein TRFO_27477 [Tritrichomonas foetus]
MSLMCRMTGGGMRNNPGPADYNIRSKMGEAPKYTIKDRFDIPERPNTAGYLNFPSTVGEGHKFSLSGRHKELDSFRTPGPEYVPPKFGSDAKKSTLHIKDNGVQDDRIHYPGPGAYDHTPRIGNDSLKYSLRSRMNQNEPSLSPGPAAYNPNFKATRKASPAATMHIRPNELSKESTPGPGQYEVNRNMGGHRASMHVRPRGLSVDSNPGPGAYTPRDNKRTNPRFTIKGRHEEVDHSLNVGYLNIGTRIGEGPKASLSGRHRELHQTPTPGPTYVPPGIGSDARKNSMHVRTQEIPDDRIRNPGPGAYDSSPRFGHDSLKYSLRGRTAKDYGDVSPGPAAYTPNFRATRKTSPAASMHIRPKEPERQQTPGYLKLPSTFSGPRYTIGNRETLDMMPM